MRFADPQWLFVGVVVVTLLSALLVRGERLTGRALALLQKARLPSLRLSHFRVRNWLRVAVATSAVAMGFVALARPQKGMHWEALERQGIDLLLVVDTSKSMDADDVKPTRIERAKLAIRDLVDRFPGDRIGLVAFAGEAFVQSPMTLDHGALLESVDALDTSVIARGGTNIGRGIDVAAEALSTEPGRQKIMVLLTDGEDLEGQGLAEAKRAAAAGITIDAVGVGTLAGELVPAHDARGTTTGIVRDEDGNPVRSHLDEAGLAAIAEATHGSYRPLGLDGRGLDRLYDDSLAKLAHTETASLTHRVYSEWFEIPLGMALLGIVLEALLGRRWRVRNGGTGPSSRAVASSMAVAAALVVLMGPAYAQASPQSAAASYAAGRFDEAAKHFEEQSNRNPKDARLAFNAGDAAYRAGHYEAADAAFKRAMAAASPRLQQRTLYNDGDVLFRLGESQKPEAREQTIARWKEAIQAYDGALALDPADADARFNRDLVKRKVEALEQKQKDESKKSDSKDSEKNPSGPKGQSGQDKSAGSTSDKSGPSGASGPNPEPHPNGTGDLPPGGGPKALSPDDSGKPLVPGGSSATVAPPPAANSAAPPGATPGQPSGPAAQPGRLSARDARALLGALRGEERRGTIRGADAGPSHDDDSPRKDW